ncbi:MAG: triose-phosphate isomerase [Bacteroidia bacterium]|nr:triose-phosphate isomerase [Bacteroidia bacterium]
MRKKIVAGNWKMNKDCDEALLLFKEINSLLQNTTAKQVEVIVLPSFIFIRDFVSLSFKIAVGAQNCSTEDAGAYTGEVSAAMIRSAGASYVIVGHSERRSYFSETNSMLSKKINAALKNNLIPIYCVGETLNQRNSGNHFKIIEQQITEGLFHLNNEQFKKTVIAYEPVWAIGTGNTATTSQAQEMHAFIRKVVAQKYGNDMANSCSVLYGGSCNAQNAKELFACPDIDGGLIGGASLKAKDFVQIVQSF